MAGSIVTAMVLSHFDYANSLPFRCLASNMAKFQHIQNTAAHIVLDTHRPWPTQQLLCHLHWLTVHFHTKFLHLIICYMSAIYSLLIHVLVVFVHKINTCSLCPQFPQS